MNDIIEEMNSGVSNDDKVKSYKDYAWKTLRVIARFFVQELKILTLNNNAKDEKLPDLEEIVRLIITSAEKL